MNKYKKTQRISDKKYQKNWPTTLCSSSLYVAQPRKWANLVLTLT